MNEKGDYEIDGREGVRAAYYAEEMLLMMMVMMSSQVTDEKEEKDHNIVFRRHPSREWPAHINLAMSGCHSAPVPWRLEVVTLRLSPFRRSEVSWTVSKHHRAKPPSSPNA